MQITFEQVSQPYDINVTPTARHLLLVTQGAPNAQTLYAEALFQKLNRRHKKPKDVLKASISADLPNGVMVTWVAIDVAKQNVFQYQTLLRNAVKPLLEEKPTHVDVVIEGDNAFKSRMIHAVCFIIGLNAAPLPSAKKEKHPLSQVTVYGSKESVQLDKTLALVEGNTLARQLTLQAPNTLTPLRYRKEIAKLALSHGWEMQTYDIKALKKMGAGAFLAVAQGSPEDDAAIIHLRYSANLSIQDVAVVGKGICFDTGGHNLKSARYMLGMHHDMNGSAVALGVLLAATKAKLPINIDCWLAIAQNHIGPNAYKQNDIVKALNKKTIEIVHTDAEGRMVLADTLTLASRRKPALLIDYATLTGSMVEALGTRYSGVISNQPSLLCQAVGVGQASGERVNAFPFDEDYDELLESKQADIKQCTIESEADHILAARFLYQFIEHKEQLSWLHVDLASYHHKGGLGAVSTDINGFGVAFGVSLIEKFMEESFTKS